jgi:ABC-type amino acid transport system permease subunit
MKRKYNFFNSQEFERLVPYLVLGFIYLVIILILFSL